MFLCRCSQKRQSDIATKWPIQHVCFLEFSKKKSSISISHSSFPSYISSERQHWTHMQWRTVPGSHFCESQQNFCTIRDPLTQPGTYDLGFLDLGFSIIACPEEAIISGW